MEQNLKKQHLGLSGASLSVADLEQVIIARSIL